jgi:acyl-CoA thioester hydrolase
MDGYPFSCRIQVRWRDLDAFAHVNNATFATYLELARTEVWRRLFSGHDAMEIPFFVKRLEIEYRRPVGLYDEVVVWLRVGEIRGASFTFEFVVTADSEVAAEALTVLACVDNRTGRVVRMDPDLRNTLETLQRPDAAEDGKGQVDSTG